MATTVKFVYHGPEAMSPDLGRELAEGDEVEVPAELAPRFRLNGCFEEVAQKGKVKSDEQ